MSESKRELVLSAATQAFVRHGFRRVTMGDIAVEARISRPSLYLVFANKEEIFTAALRRWADRAVAQINEGIAGLGSTAERLRFALEVWTVRPYELLRQHPEARDLIEPGHEFVRGTYDEVQREFEEVLARILADADTDQGADLRATARMLASGALGLRARAESARDLRDLIDTAIAATVGLVGRGVAG